jgi:hypothetical protein
MEIAVALVVVEFMHQYEIVIIHHQLMVEIIVQVNVFNINLATLKTAPTIPKIFVVSSAVVLITTISIW